jgi:hypothetical protein
MSPTRQTISFIGDCLRYNISPLEWYQFCFASQTPDQKANWAGTGTMYEFQREANPMDARHILMDKRLFYQAYGEFFQHSLWSLEEFEADHMLAARVLSENERLVFKDANGNCGASVKILPASELSSGTLIPWMRERGFDLVESFARQHHDLNALSPSAVNTVRVFTLIDEAGNYRILGCRLRISVDSHVDNLAAGNLAAPVDEGTGIVNGPGVYSDVTRKPESVHPITGTPIEDFRIPFWPEILELVKQASLKHPRNRSVGWDVVVTENGPGLIEGNHDWCKLVWQLPVDQGLKPMLGPS